MYTQMKWSIYDFNIFKRLGDLIRSIYYVDVLLQQAIDKQYKIEALLRSLDAYRTQREGKKQSRKEFLDNAFKLFEDREMIIIYKCRFSIAYKITLYQEGDEDKYKEFIQ